MELQSNNEDLEQIKEDQEFYEHHKFVIEKGHTLMRIDKFLINRIENVSRNKIQNAAKADCVLVNGKPVKSSYKVKPYDLVSVVMPEPPRVAELIPEEELGADYIIPKAFDPRVGKAVASAVAKAAKDSGAARL